MKLRAIVALAAALAALAPALPAAARRKPRHSRRTADIALKRRLYTGTLITDPGNVDWEFSGLYDTGGSFWLPSTIRFTPAAAPVEFSASLDTLAVEQGGGTHFSDHVTFAATWGPSAWRGISVALAPAASFFLRGESGARVGGFAAARWDHRTGWSVSSSLSWSGATHVSETNSAGVWDANWGLARQTGRWTLFGSGQSEWATGVARLDAIFEGVEYECSERLALDAGAMHYGIGTGRVDHQFQVGFVLRLTRGK